MAFWSGEKLASRLPALVTPFDQDRIDCAAYTLAVGPNVFITEDEPPTGDPRKSVKFVVGPNEPFRIPPGQFAFLTTEEIVAVPNDALAFISMKATYKFRGLVNVSGFHVDPGWKGSLVFSVYNAGPAPVHLSRGLPLFLIWYSDLDRPTEKTYKPKPGIPGLRDELISNMSGQVFSPMNLSGQLSKFRDNLSGQLTKVREEQMQLKADLESFKKLSYGVGGAVLAVVLALVGTVFGLVGEPFRDFLLKEYADHQIKAKGSDIKPEENSGVQKGSPKEDSRPIDVMSDKPLTGSSRPRGITDVKPLSEERKVGAGSTELRQSPDQGILKNQMPPSEKKLVPALKNNSTDK